MVLTPKRVTVKDPLQIAYFVYAQSKLTMLTFLYDFLDLYFPRTVYEICCTDTDSLYYAYTKNETDDFEDWVKPELRESYFRNRGRFLPSQACSDSICFEHFVDCKSQKHRGFNRHAAIKQSCFTTELRDFLKRSMKEMKFAFWLPKHTAVKVPPANKNSAAKGSIKESTLLKWMISSVLCRMEPSMLF